MFLVEDLSDQDADIWYLILSELDEVINEIFLESLWVIHEGFAHKHESLADSESRGQTEPDDVCYDRLSELFIVIVEVVEQRSDFLGSFFSDDGNRIAAEFEADWGDDLENDVFREDRGQFVDLIRDQLSDTPFLLVLLQLEEYFDHVLTFLRVKNFDERSQVFNHAVLDFFTYESVCKEFQASKNYLDL